MVKALFPSVGTHFNVYIGPWADLFSAHHVKLNGKSKCYKARPDPRPVTLVPLKAIRCFVAFNKRAPSHTELRILGWLEKNPSRRTELWAAEWMNNRIKYILGRSLSQVVAKEQDENKGEPFGALKRFMNENGLESYF